MIGFISGTGMRHNENKKVRQVNTKAIVSTFDPLKVCLCSNRKLTYSEHPARQERGCSSGSSLAKTHLGQAKIFFSFFQPSLFLSEFR